MELVTSLLTEVHKYPQLFLRRGFRFLPSYHNSGLWIIPITTVDFGSSVILHACTCLVNMLYFAFVHLSMMH